MLKIVGRPKHFADNDELLYFFIEYLEECKQDNKYPNLAGFARKCWCCKDTLLEYRKEGHVFTDTMKQIYSYLEDATLNNTMTDNFKKFYVINTFKEYKDKSEVETITNNIDDISKLSDEELAKRLEELEKKLKK